MYPGTAVPMLASRSVEANPVRVRTKFRLRAAVDLPGNSIKVSYPILPVEQVQVPILVIVRRAGSACIGCEQHANMGSYNSV